MEHQFSVADWAVFVSILVISACIGIYHALTGGKQKTTKEFLMGNREMSCLPVAVSILVSFQSAILILGAPAEMYTKGTQYYLYVFGQMSAVVLATILFVPLFYPLKMTSMYQYLEMRYNSKAARLTGTIISNLSMLIYTGIASFAPSTALQAVSGFPQWASFIIIGCICTFYTFMGGLKAVIWVDVFQALIMVAGILAIVIRATLDVGGFDRVWEINSKWNRIDFWNFDPDPTVRHTFWALVIGGMINWTGTYGASQSSIQRFSALSSLNEARKAVMLNCVGVFIMITTSCVAGISVFAYYAEKGCDPLANKDIKNSNQIIPYFVSEMLGFPGIPGLFIAGLFCGALSTLSSNLSSMVAVTYEDMIKPFIKPSKPEAVKIKITKLLVLIYGVLGILVTFLFRNLKGTVLQASLSFMGAAGGALNGLIMLGAFFPWANWQGAIVGTITAYIVSMWIGIGKYTVVGVKDTLPSPVYNCSIYMYNVSIASSTNVTMTTMSSIVAYNTSGMLTNYSMLVPNSESTTSSLIQDSQPGLESFYSLSYLWYSTFGMLITFVVGLTVSFITGPTKPEDVNPDLMIPIFDRLFWFCLPKKVLHFLRFGVDYEPDNGADNDSGVTETTFKSSSEVARVDGEDAKHQELQPLSHKHIES
ncbi:sodium-coupled monocarboxylate transporter 1-like [Mytilus californianus]|uniref:sodium-coupled monocarboxylate transporter 1-like n=1 Tax=Mytilus californianus TaxID=6549 RepID=UPI002247370D|nr:sodium-coupled monocarboxylate transporter 1-like [Mytilus californianus]